MIGNIGNHIYYRIYLRVSATNKTSPVMSAAGAFGASVCLNIMSVYFLLDIKQDLLFFLFMGLGAVSWFYILFHYSDGNAKAVIRDYASKDLKRIWVLLIDFYFDISLLLLVVSIGFQWGTFLFTLVLLVLLRLIVLLFK